MRSFWGKLLASWLLALAAVAALPPHPARSAEAASEGNGNQPAAPTLSIIATPTPADAVASALGYVSLLPEHDRPFVRFFWLSPTSTYTTYQALCYTIHATISQTANFPAIPLIADGQLAVVNVRDFDTSHAGQLRIIEVLDSLATQEPFFHAPAAPRADVIANFQPGQTVQVFLTGNNADGSASVNGYRGQFYDAEFLSHVASGIRVRVPHKTDPIAIHDIYVKAGTDVVHAGHLGVENITTLARETHSDAPIFEAEWFITKALSQVDGGVYYALSQIDRIKKQPNQSDLDAMLASLGINRKFAEGRDHDPSVAIISSGVTRGPRQVTLYQGSHSAVASSGLFRITWDIAKGDTGIRQDPLYNLLDPDFAASEAIGSKPNGLDFYLLYNDAGALQTEVPPDIAIDTTIPRYACDARLHTAISCIRCHFPSRDGFQEYQNDVTWLLSRGVELLNDDDFINPATGKKRAFRGFDDVRAARDRLYARYKAEHDKPAFRAREDLAEAVAKASGGLSPQEIVTELSRVFDERVYQLATPQRSLLLAGYAIVSDNETNLAPFRPGINSNSSLLSETESDRLAKYALQALLPPLDKVHGTEDVGLVFLKGGRNILSFQFERMYSDLRLRARLIEDQREEREEMAKHLTETAKGLAEAEIKARKQLQFNRDNSGRNMPKIGTRLHLPVK